MPYSPKKPTAKNIQSWLQETTTSTNAPPGLRKAMVAPGNGHATTTFNSILFVRCAYGQDATPKQLKSTTSYLSPKVAPILKTT